jgi:membrane glycosyltransferase
MPSRLHMATGIMSYLASPLWLLLLVVSGLEMFLPSGIAPFAYFGRQPELPLLVPQAVPLLQLTTATLVLLYAPKLLATVVLFTQPAAMKEHGGAGGVVRSVLLESVFATLFAPVAMLSHSWFLLNILVGRATGWGTQARSDRALPFWFVVKHFWMHTLIGVAVTYMLYRFAPDSLPWFLPLLVGLILAIPVVEITSSLKLGEALARVRTFLVPSETTIIPVLKRASQLLARREDVHDSSDYRHLVLDDPSVMALHLRLLKEAPPAVEMPRTQLAALADAARRRDTRDFTRQDWVALLSDMESLEATRS